MNNLPHDIEIEKSVIGTALLDINALIAVMSKLNASHFYGPNNKKIFEAMAVLYFDNKPVDAQNVVAEIGFDYFTVLMEMQSFSVGSANVKYKCALLVQFFVAREIMKECEETIKMLSQPGVDPFEVRSSLLMTLEGLSVSRSKEAVKLEKTVGETLKNISDIQESSTKVSGIDTGYRSVNELLHGWKKPDLIIIAARPGFGKTALALNFASKIAKQGRPVGFISLEMDETQLSERLISMDSGVFLTNIRKADLNETHWKFIHAEKFNYPLYLFAPHSITVDGLKEAGRSMKRKFGIEALYIDYLQLVKGGVENKQVNRTNELGYVSRSIKGLAKELEIPITALAQVGRDVEKQDRPPRLSDLRECGDIEQDADIVSFLWAPRETLVSFDIQGNEVEANSPEINWIVEKHRGGARGTVKLIFDKPHQKFIEA